MSRLLYPIKIEKRLSQNFSYRPAGLDSVLGGIFHWTASNANAIATAEYLQRESVEAACWCVIGKGGLIVISVPLNKAAWHAGLGQMDFNSDGDFRDRGEMTMNSSTFGIEHVGSYGGPWPHEQMYSSAYMVRRADRLCHNFKLRNITDHAKIALPKGRKVDVDKSFRCEEIFWWVEHPYSKLPSTERMGVYKKLPLWAQRNCDEIWQS